MLQKLVSCLGCPLYEMPFGSTHGWVGPHGDGSNGVLIIAEAAGKEEAEKGIPLVGRAGQYLFTQLQRAGIERDGFVTHNVLSCRPPDNKLAGMPFEAAAIKHCAPNLDATIASMKPKVIFTLGRIAFKRVMGYEDKHPVMRADYLCYPHWNDTYQCWVVAADHPAFLMRGKHNLAGPLQYAAKRALEIAQHGVESESLEYLLDPAPATFQQWVDDYLRRMESAGGDLYLSYDIETPHKSGKDESEIAREDEDDYTILRISFCYEPGRAVSVPWAAAYMPNIERLFAAGKGIGWNSSVYDDARIQNQMPMPLVKLDAMLAWHVLNSALPKGLGYVTPFYWPNCKMWKHLADSKPAFYNAKDADAALRCWLGIRRDLAENDQQEVFERHVVQLNEVLSYMSRKGVLLDQTKRLDAERMVAGLLAEVEVGLDAAVPLAARSLKVYKKAPKDTQGLVQVEGEVKSTSCDACGAVPAPALHFKSVGKKRLNTCRTCGKQRKQHCDLDEPGLDHADDCELLHHEFKGEIENPCHGSKAVKVTVPAQLWAKPLEFKISKVGMQRYQSVMGHKAVLSRRERKVTFDENAIQTLMRNYPNDKLYPIIGEQRKLSKLLGTYVGVTENGKVVGGLPLGRDGRVHTLYTHNPSTLRLASQQPNLQNLPRPSKNKEALENLIRGMIVATPGHILHTRDFSGIEAVLVGYEARAKGFTRLALRDVHSFYTAYAINALEPDRFKAADLPSLEWDDDKLFAHLAGIKSEFSSDRNNLYKHLVHAVDFGQEAKGAQAKIYLETGIEHPVPTIARVMGVYKELFPEIPKWHQEVRLQADRDGFLRNAFSYIHRFNHVFGWKREHGQWVRTLGEDAQAVLAFKPQSNAAGIMKEALLRCYARFEEIGQYLRLTVHDEILLDVPEDRLDVVRPILQEEMERPIPQLPLPESWGMGPYLAINTEDKSGYDWGSMC